MSKWYSNRDTVSGLHDVPVLVVLCLPSNSLSSHWISKAKLLLCFHFGPFKHCLKLQPLSLGWKYKNTALKSSKSEFMYLFEYTNSDLNLFIPPGFWKDHTQPFAWPRRSVLINLQTSWRCHKDIWKLLVTTSTAEQHVLIRKVSALAYENKYFSTKKPPIYILSSILRKRKTSLSWHTAQGFSLILHTHTPGHMLKYLEFFFSLTHY